MNDQIKWIEIKQLLQILQPDEKIKTSKMMVNYINFLLTRDILLKDKIKNSFKNIIISKHHNTWLCLDGHEQLNALYKFQNNEFCIMSHIIDRQKRKILPIYIYYSKIPKKLITNILPYVYGTLTQERREEFDRTLIHVVNRTNDNDTQEHIKEIDKINKIDKIYKIDKIDKMENIENKINVSFNKSNKFIELLKFNEFAQQICLYAGINHIQKTILLNIIYMQQTQKIRFVKSNEVENIIFDYLNDKVSYLNYLDDYSEEILGKLLTNNKFENTFTLRILIYFKFVVSAHTKYNTIINYSNEFIVVMFHLFERKLGKKMFNCIKFNLSQLNDIMIIMWIEWNNKYYTTDNIEIFFDKIFLEKFMKSKL